MAATAFDSSILARLFPGGEVGRLFSDSAEVRAMMLVEGALAKAQGAAGIIPDLSAAAIHRASLELQIDPAGLADETGRNGVCVPALVAAFRALMQAPEHAQYLHRGATSQDIQDSALMLRLRQVLALYETALDRVLAALARQADRHAGLPMLARTYGQAATPTSFGAFVAGWGWPLLTLRARLPALRDDVLWVSLAGASGTASELGPDPAALRAALAKGLGLRDPGRSWHSDRTPVTTLAAWIAQVAAALGKMGEDLILSTQSGIGEIRLAGAGASSTMPQKQNPVGPSALVALARHIQGLNGTLQGAALHRQARDGAAWFTEWLVLPQLCLSLAAALDHAARLAETLDPVPQALDRGFAATRGSYLAEALSFELAARMPRPEAQAQVKALCLALTENGQDLRQAAQARWPDLPDALFDPARHMGQAPDEARAFARAVAQA